MSPPPKGSIEGPERAPANRTETKAQSEAGAEAEPEEGDVSRRPSGPQTPICGPRPPAPSTAPPAPTAVVVRRPAPGFIGNPGPSPIRLPRPTAIIIGYPVRSNIRSPDIAVVGRILPLAVLIKVLGARVVAVRVLPALSFLDGAVAIVVPSIPLVIGRGTGNLVLGIVRAPNVNNLAFFHSDAALRS